MAARGRPGPATTHGRPGEQHRRDKGPVNLLLPLVGHAGALEPEKEAPVLRSWIHLPRRSVRLRLTALYGALFLLSGAGLLAVTYGVVTGRPINASFGVEQSVGRGQIVLKAVPLQAKRLVAYSGCMRGQGIANFPMPKVINGGRVVAMTEQSSGGVVKRTPKFAAATLVCAMKTGVPTGVAVFAASGGPAGALPSIGQGSRSQQTHISPRPPFALSAVLPTPAEKRQWLGIGGAALGVMALVSIGLGWLMAGRALRPVRLMTATARHISEDNLDARLAIAGPDDELKDLADTFDGLLGRLEGAFDAQRRFVANASHELRTPLAMMRTSLDVALGKPNPPREVKVLAGKLEEGLDQAEKLLDNLLVLARSQRGALGSPEPVSLRALARVSLEADHAELARLKLSAEDNTSPADVMGNEILLARMVANVVDNAIRHNVAGGFVRISSGSDGRWARLVVENGGPVIAPERVAQLGEPFFRPGAERIVDGNGSGLGLSIAKAVAASHGGALVLHARPEGGLQVVIELPAALTSGGPRLVPGAGRWPTDGHSGAGNGAKTSGGSAEARPAGAGP